MTEKSLKSSFTIPPKKAKLLTRDEFDRLVGQTQRVISGLLQAVDREEELDDCSRDTLQRLGVELVRVGQVLEKPFLPMRFELDLTVTETPKTPPAEVVVPPPTTPPATPPTASNPSWAVLEQINAPEQLADDAPPPMFQTVIAGRKPGVPDRNDDIFPSRPGPGRVVGIDLASGKDQTVYAVVSPNQPMRDLAGINSKIVDSPAARALAPLGIDIQADRRRMRAELYAVELDDLVRHFKQQLIKQQLNLPQQAQSAYQKPEKPEMPDAYPS